MIYMQGWGPHSQHTLAAPEWHDGMDMYSTAPVEKPLIEGRQTRRQQIPETLAREQKGFLPSCSGLPLKPPKPAACSSKTPEIGSGNRMTKDREGRVRVTGPSMAEWNVG